MNDKPWLAHYDRGVPEHLDYPSVPLQFFLREAARKYPNTACTIFKGARISYSKMDRITDRLAAALKALGVKKGERVGILMPNTPQFVMAFFAILKAGGVVVATNPLYGPREIEEQFNDAGIRVAFVMTNFYLRLKSIQAKTGLQTIIAANVKETLPAPLRALFTFAREEREGHRITLQAGDYWMTNLIDRHNPGGEKFADVGADDAALFQYSGGTTGVPKGAVALHRNLVANTLQVRAWFVTANEGHETMLMAIPLFHVYGIVAGMCVGISLGASLVMVPDPRDMKDLLSSIEVYETTLLPGVPTLYNSINNHADVQAGHYNLRCVKACISGSAPLLKETKDCFELLTGGKLVEGYGLSEAPSATHSNPLLGVNKTGSIGMPLPDVNACIVSLEDETTLLPAGQVGELVLQGPQVMKGYHNMPTETNNTLRDGWLHTGDIAFMDEDGYFFIIDRKKELIKPGGYQVWPREVEEAILENPKVQDVAVAGVPDPYRGETIKAWIVLKPGEKSSLEEIRRWCQERIALFKVPTQVEFRNDLPRTTVGKLLRRELVREHLEMKD
jgi:long-chain acyl-CoA synthetase